jgi:hypothetical protein
MQRGVGDGFGRPYDFIGIACLHKEVGLQMSKTTRLTLLQIKDTQEYSVLTGKQQLFVETYCKTGIDTGTYDPVFATMQAYACKTREVARIMSYSLMANIRIVAVLNRHFNRTPIEEFLTLLDHAIRNKKLTVAQFQALKLKGDILGYTTRLPGTNNMPLSSLPPDVVAATDEARKAKRKKPVRAEKPEEPWEYANH